MNEQAEESGAMIDEKLLEAWKQEQRFFHLRGLARFLIWLVAMVLVDFVIDWQIFFRSRWEAPGVLLLILNLAILSWVLWREWLRHLKPFDSLRVALEVENKHPELRSVLVSFTQLKDFDAKEAQASPALLEAMRKQAISLTRPLDFREVVDFRQLKSIALVSLASIAIFMAISFEWQEQMGLLFKRMLGENLEYPTETRIVSTTGDKTIKSGDTVTISTRVEGLIPAKGSLIVRFESGEEKSLEKPVDGTNYSWELPSISERLSYYVEIGDDRSDDFTISVSPTPEITGTSILLSYPEYLDQNDSSTDSLNLSVPQGTRIKWRLQCQPAIRALKVTWGEDVLDANISVSGTEAVFEVTADQTAKYSFQWTEKKYGFEYDDIQHLVRVVPGRVPDIELLEPLGNGVGTVDKVLQLVAKATDDFVWIRKDINSGSLNLMIYELPNKTLLNRSYSQIRDSISKLYIPGPIDGTSMSIDDGYITGINEGVLNGGKNTGYRGLWEVKDKFMAGPFIGYEFEDTKNQRKIYVDGFVYAPSVKKRSYIFELESIIKSIIIN